MKNDAAGKGAAPTVGWSDFAAGRHMPGGRHTWYEGGSEELLDRVRKSWPNRRPGGGRDGLDQVVIVPVEPQGFTGTTVLADEGTRLHAVFDRRQPQEEGFLRVTAEADPEPVRHAAVVLYSAATLLENGGTRSTDCEWEIVCLLAGPQAEEPMDPVTMARNYLEKAGGTFCEYSAREFAESIWYWRRRATVHRDE